MRVIIYAVTFSSAASNSNNEIRIDADTLRVLCTTPFSLCGQGSIAASLYHVPLHPVKTGFPRLIRIMTVPVYESFSTDVIHSEPERSDRGMMAGYISY